MSGDCGTLRIELLGPVRAWRGQRELRIGSAQRRAVLAMLAMRGGRPVAADEIARGLATQTPARRATSRVAAHMTGLRGVLDGCGAERTVLDGTAPDAPASDGLAPDGLAPDGPAPGRSGPHSSAPAGPVPGGSVPAEGGPRYLLRLDPAALDAGLLDGDLASARGWCAAGRLHAAARALDAAVARFHGQPLHAVPGPWAAAERERLAELWLAVQEERVEVMLALGQHYEAVPLLTGLIREHPQRERFLGQLMVALYRSGRRAEALARFAEARPVPAGRPARPPGPGLLRLQLQILTGDSALMTMVPPGGGLPGTGLPGSAFSGRALPGGALAGGALLGGAMPGSVSREGVAADQWRRSAAPSRVPRAAR